MTNWLPLTEYSNKYRVSVSTLRRRIRSNKCEFTYEDGKYLLKDASLDDHHPNNRKESQFAEAGSQASANSAQVVTSSPQNEEEVAWAPESEIYDTAVAKILQELKGAYSLVLQEKEEQIMILKDEVADLQTLVRVLETENERLKKLSDDKLVARQSSFIDPASKADRHEIDPASMLKDGDWMHELDLDE